MLHPRASPLRILGRMAETAGNESEPEIARLLGACARQDRRAFQRLYESTSPQLLACLIRLLRDRAHAEDALQEVYLQVWNRAGEFRPERGSSWAWLISIARYRGIDLQRREKRLVAGGDDGLETVATEDEPLEALMALGRRASATLDRCMGALQERQRHCIVLAYQDGLSHAEVASRVGEPLGSVKSWIRRGLAALKRCLES
ncbi:MAG: sigma-70 family RNA polymerase sigma factor [Steroidobacteraceae bacterium]